VCTAAPPAEVTRVGGGAATPAPRTPLAGASPSAGRGSPAPPPPPLTPTQPQLEAARPLDLWALGGAALGFAPPASDAAGASSSGAAATAAAVAAIPASSAPAHELPSPAGRFFAAAQVWPAAKQPKGLAAASPALLASLGRPGPGSRLGLYRCSVLVAASGAGAPSTGGPNSSGGGADGSHASEAATVWLRACRDAREPSLLAVAGEGRAAGQDGGAAAAAAAGAGTASPATPKRPPKDQGGASSSGGRASGAGAAAVAAADGWRRRLLAAGLDWSNARVRHLADRLAARQLEGRWLLPGGAHGPTLDLQAYGAAAR
jgi:hypothetical protein